jgi:hypothetical protein
MTAASCAAITPSCLLALPPQEASPMTWTEVGEGPLGLMLIPREAGSSGAAAPSEARPQPP